MQSSAKMLISVTAVATFAQLAWFGSKAFRQIDYDGMAYTGIAGQLRLWHFQDSLNAFRSPLISWLIAIVPATNLVYAGKLITITTFLLTLVTLYFFTLHLWHSHTVAATATLLMVLARGVSFFAVAFVTPDFLLTALVLVYFLALLECLRGEQDRWWGVGVVHGLAFLAKAIAFPWLAVCTFTSVVVSDGSWRAKCDRAVSALFIPILIALLWGSALHARYGVFTIGSQFKTNLLQWTLRGTVPNGPSQYKMLSDVAGQMNGFADDPMPPGSWEWSYHPSISILVPRIISAEMRNIPRAIKEISIMLTIGIQLGFVIVLSSLHKERRGRPEWAVAVTIALGSITLIFAYSMLVIDNRYLFPLIALWFGVGARALWSNWVFDRRNLRRCCVTLTVLGTCFSLFYRSSPFRTQTRDWQVVCREVGTSLKLHGAATTVTLGSGPFPGHGVGWEAGYTSSYFGSARLIAASEFLPSDYNNLSLDVARAAPEAVLLWCTDPQTCASIRKRLQDQYPVSESILDPKLGDVGFVLYRRTAAKLSCMGIAQSCSSDRARSPHTMRATYGNNSQS